MRAAAIAAWLALVACGMVAQPSEENGATNEGIRREACPTAGHPVLVISRLHEACCARGWMGHGSCLAARPREHANFCMTNGNPHGSELDLEPGGDWMCCGGYECGN